MRSSTLGTALSVLGRGVEYVHIIAYLRIDLRCLRSWLCWLTLERRTIGSWETGVRKRPFESFEF